MEPINRLISISGGCLESYPCQHRCLVEYASGEREWVTLLGTEIIKFWDTLSNSERQHFSYLIPMKQKCRYPGCDAPASFHHTSDKTHLWCSEHKLPGMNRG